MVQLTNVHFIFSEQMISKTSFFFFFACFLFVAAAASSWQDNSYDQLNTLQDMLDQNFAQGVSVSNPLLKIGHFPASFTLFSSFQYSFITFDGNKICPYLDLNWGYLMSEVTALPTYF